MRNYLKVLLNYSHSNWIRLLLLACIVAACTSADKNNSGILEGWLPGEKAVPVSYRLPASLEQGDYELEMGVVFHNSIEHTIPIANKGKTSDGWYKLGNLKVTD